MRKFLLGLAALTAVTTGLVVAATSVFGPDVGPKADVTALRAVVRNEEGASHAEGVHVVGNYGLVIVAMKDGNGDPAHVYKRISGERWKLTMGGGGAIREGDLVQHGVPASIARQLCSGWPKGYAPC